MSQDTTLEQTEAGNIAHQFGWYRFYFDDERWEWSAEVAQIHGYEPGSVVPTTRLVLSHKHPDDYEHVAASLEEIRRTHKPFSTRHRVVTVDGRTREVVVIGERMHDHTGRVIGTQGFYIDVTPAAETQSAIISEAVAEIAENRAAIEQAKGILMLVYRIDADAAFDLMKWRSQETNVKVRALADQFMADIRSLEYDEDVPPRATFDRLLLTVHQRVRAKAAGRQT
ncbi:PAS and ANTAR domain-containing protein [Mycolicibacterium sp. 120270]|uniref:PAS and ANTAR domain-containing protein n=1 Tax=Mycolicibacterium sp. 120270 TaxID=3090600 RepID=UPI00299ECAF9|nr:PAS and ANTAR domain-containing protein [Mycolicibacterium sp. 120270]MDX1885883.1 PAS and ANTAR domain-containing protein [Mycolicibacterium sp. 120270]